MYEEEEYGFCPQCGALMRQGKCVSCGYGRETDGGNTDENAAVSAPSDGEVRLGGAIMPDGSVPPDGLTAPGASITPGASGVQEESGVHVQGMPAYGAYGSEVSGQGTSAPGACGQGESGQVTSDSGVYGQGVSGAGMPGPGVYGQGASGMGVPGPGAYGQGASGAGVPGPGVYGPGASGAGVPGSGSYGPGMPGQGMPVPGAYGQGAYGPGAYGPGAPGQGQGYGPYGQGTYGPGSYGQYGYTQNGYGAGNYGQQPYGGQPPVYGPYGYGNVNNSDRNSNRIVAAVIVSAIAILLCVVLVLVFFLAKGAMEQAMGSANAKWDYGMEQEPVSPEAEDPFAFEPEDIVPEEDYVPSPEDDYYVNLANSVRDDLSYQIEWEEYNYVDDETQATASGRYPQLVGGNIPHLEELNAAIEEEATYYSNLYGYYKDWQEDGSLYASSSVGYVTFMDEDKISIVLQEQFMMDGTSSISLYSMNIDLVSGTIMDNGSIIEYSDTLAAAFRDQNDYQNGYVEAVDDLTDEELTDFLSDTDTNIIFFTPVGLEIGYNYTTDTSSGWVTATLKDYERYTPKF